MLFPIGFSIPESKLVDKVPEKKLYLATYRPGDAYSYSSEKEYHNGYKDAIFGYTCKKAGWDCFRHYEILANGCIPWFPGLKQCPPNTMTLFPKDLVLKAMSKVKDIHSPEAKTRIEELLKYTREHLTTRAMAKYVLEKSNNTDARKILFLSGNTWSDYLRCLTLHGFKELFGPSCHDFPRISHLYRDFPDEKLGELYGKGMGYSQLLEGSTRDDTLDTTLVDDIINHKYDSIIYGSLHRGLPYFDLVNAHYQPKDIIILCGEDLHDTCEAEELSEKGYMVFKREL
jgi:hypothetical protein